ncbi:PAAR domain-containing protein [Morganella morganii]|uniref:PAAR domain-containing protein n=1 Tax=Morganella morganii TaxID=582 RepID=UPI0030FEBB8D
MAGKQVICLGDTTDHGGVVISALDNYTVNGHRVATEGDSVSCPKCKGVFQIASGSSLMTFQGKKNCPGGHENHLWCHTDCVTVINGIRVTAFLSFRQNSIISKSQEEQ